jgi:hypothetical protein
MQPYPRRWPFALLLLVSLGSFLFCCSGVIMAGSFSVSNPESLQHWRRLAYIYLGLCGLSLVGITIAGVVLWRRTRERATQIAPAS